MNPTSQPNKKSKSKSKQKIELKPITKEELIDKLKDYNKQQWIKSTRKINSQGAVGHTLEDLIGIPENNLPIPNAAEWELKAQRLDEVGKTTSLLTLFHFEPSPRALRLVPRVLIPKYGWTYAGTVEKPDARSFRQTIGTTNFSDRGFKVVVNHELERVEISFDATKVSESHSDWLKTVEERVGNLNQLETQPYWGIKDLEYHAGEKLKNCFYVLADRKTENGEEYFWYKRVFILKNFKFEVFMQYLEQGKIAVDFDARTRHNHGTKFRIQGPLFANLYEYAEELSLT